MTSQTVRLTVAQAVVTYLKGCFFEIEEVHR